MQYHNYNSLYATIKEQYSRPQESEGGYNYSQGNNQYQMNDQGSLMNFLSEGEFGKSLMNLYNIPTIDNLLKTTKTAITPEKPVVQDDRNSYLYIHNS